MTTQHTTGSTTMGRPAGAVTMLLVSCLASGCGGTKGSEGAGDAGGAATSSTTGDAETTQTEGSAGSGTGQHFCGHVPGDLDWDALGAMCEAAADAGACEGEVSAAVFEASQSCGGCVWDDWVPTSLDGEGKCVYGEAVTRCRLVVLGTEGCVGGAVCGEPGKMPMWRTGADGGVELHVGPSLECSYPPGVGVCAVDAGGNVQGDAPPECACLCDPNFPDEP